MSKHQLWERWEPSCKVGASAKAPRLERAQYSQGIARGQQSDQEEEEGMRQKGQLGADLQDPRGLKW